MTEVDPLPPDCARTYRWVRRIAAGGFGAVHEAQHRDLERVVAIKVLHGHGVDDPRQLVRFQDEARVTASLSHPNIIQVLDHGTGRGSPWIAYEYVAGPSLREQLDAGHLPVEQVILAGFQVADALAAAHAVGVLHRDIKPDNVLQVSEGHYKVADFGIAKWSGQAVQTATGMILGTPAYLSPEQLTGKSAIPQSDLYALGIMLYELSTGTLPFPADKLMPLIQHHLRTPAPRPRDRKPRMPVELEAIILSALAKHPEDRPVSAAAMRDSLGEISPAVSRWLATRPLAVGVPGATVALPGRVARTAGGGRRPGVAAIVAGALAAGLSLALVGAWRDRAPATSPVPAGFSPERVREIRDQASRWLEETRGQRDRFAELYSMQMESKDGGRSKGKFLLDLGESERRATQAMRELGPADAPRGAGLSAGIQDVHREAVAILATLRVFSAMLFARVHFEENRVVRSPFQLAEIVPFGSAHMRQLEESLDAILSGLRLAREEGSAGAGLRCRILPLLFHVGIAARYGDPRPELNPAFRHVIVRFENAVGELGDPGTQRVIMGAWTWVWPKVMNRGRMTTRQVLEDLRNLDHGTAECRESFARIESLIK